MVDSAADRIATRPKIDFLEMIVTGELEHLGNPRRIDPDGNAFDRLSVGTDRAAVAAAGATDHVAGRVRRIIFAVRMPRRTKYLNRIDREAGSSRHAAEELAPWTFER